MMEAFRCVHASRLLLDHQLHGTQLADAAPMEPGGRRSIEDATLVSFEQIVEACLVHEADCLLLSGDCLDPLDGSLRGAAALVRGMQRLAEHDVPVIIEAANPEQWSRWPAGLRFPLNAHRIGDGFESAVSIARQGRLLATIALAGPADVSENSQKRWQVSLSDASLPGASGSASIVPLDNVFRPAQGMHPHETGPGGCVLVESDAMGKCRQTFIATAPVRWQSFALVLSSETTRDDLLQDMASLLAEVRREPCERVWLVAWRFSGAGPLLEALELPAGRDELIAELEAFDPVPNVRIHCHAWRVDLLQPACQDPADEADLAGDYRARLDERMARSESARQGSLEESALCGGPWAVKIESLCSQLDGGEVAHDARKMAMHWFAACEELSS